MFWIALAAQLSAPEPRYMWLSNDDTPVGQLGNHSAAEVRIQLTIAPNGRVHRCDVGRSSGNAQIDNYTCDLARRRAVFVPARSQDGAIAYGVYRVTVMWRSNAAKPELSGDLAVPLNPAPRGVQLPVTVRVAFAVDANGHISVCGDEPPSLPGIAQNNPNLVPIACDQIRTKFPVAAAIDDNGSPISSVQNATVVFTKH